MLPHFLGEKQKNISGAPFSFPLGFHQGFELLTLARNPITAFK
jgi:hypothetical protein